MPTAVEQVESWYSENAERLSEMWSLEVNSIASAHPENGKVNIRLKSLGLLASITFWNKGNIEVLAMQNGSDDTLIIDDRKLLPTEDVNTLLDEYFLRLLYIKSEGLHSAP